ncbi:flavin reductase family protein [Methylopila musalis]
MRNGEHRDALKAAMRRMPGAVCLVTTVDPSEGAPAGLAASAVIPISMDPPSMLISINSQASAHGPIARSGRFCINLLATDQTDLVGPFADSARRDERFSAEDWARHEGVPYLPNACAAIFCEVQQEVPFGTHTLFIGEVAHIVGRDGAAAPLGWIEGGFATIEPLALARA